MRMIFSIVLMTLILPPIASAPSLAFASPTSTSRTQSNRYVDYEIAVYSPELILHGGGRGILGKAAVDSFYVYGGPGTDDRYGDAPSNGGTDSQASDGWIDGKFENQFKQPAVQAGTSYPSDGWFGVDLTEADPFWQLSTFNSPTGTQAIWSGQSAAQQPGWVSGAGYGNNWNDWIDYRVTVSNNANPTNLTWTFTYNHDTEPIYDFFRAQYDSAGTMIDLVAVDNTNKDSLGVFTPVAGNASVTIQPGDYVGAGSNEVHLRFRTDSDGGWSDEDGLWPTVGAVQIDDVTVDLGANGGAQPTDDFNAGFGAWVPTSSDFSGDFAKVFPQIGDIDPCADNRTPQVGFIDDNTPVNNGGGTTGGSVSAANGYGVAGGFVVNFDGGVSGATPVNNVVRSPAINFDISPGSTDASDTANGVLLLAFDRWTHLPLGNGQFYIWSIRSTDDTPGIGDDPTDDLTNWTGWVNNNFVYYGGGVPVYGRTSVNVADKIPDFSTVTYLQIELGITDLADQFAFPGNDATPSPTFDNVSLQKAAAPGPAFTTTAIDLLQDSFTGTGTETSSFTGTAADNVFAVRVDRASAINGAGAIAIAGDSLSVDVLPVVPGTTLTGPGVEASTGGITPQLKYLLVANSSFATLANGGPRDVSTHAGVIPGAAGGWDVYYGTSDGDSTRTSTGATVANRFAFDVPFDGEFDRNITLLNDPVEPNGFFPGDRFFYYIEATDSAGNTTTIPFGQGGGSPPNNFPSSAWPPTAASLNIATAKRSGPCIAFKNSEYNKNWYITAFPTIWDTSGKNGARVAVQPDILVINDAFGFGNQPEINRAFDNNGVFQGRDYDEFTVMGPSSGVDNGIGSAGVHGATAGQLSGYSCIIYDGGNLSSLLLSDGTDATASVDRGNDQQVLTDWHNQSADRYAAYFGDFLYSFLNANGVSYLQNILAVELGPGGANVRPNIGNQSAPTVAPTGAGTSAGLFSANYVAFGGCPAINQFDDIAPLTGSPAVRSHEYLAPNGSSGAYAAAASVWHDRVEGGFRKVDLSFAHGLQFVQSSATAPNARAALVAEVLTAFGHGGSPGGAVDTPAALGQFALGANHPNPFNPKTTITFEAPQRGRMRLTIFDLRGRLVRVLLDEEVERGPGQIEFDGRDASGARLSSGMYLYRLEGFGQSETRKMMLLK